MTNKTNNLGLVLGIIGIVCAGISFFACWWLCFFAIVLGIVGMFFPERACAGVSLGVGIVSLIATIVVFVSMGVWGR